MLVFWEYGSDMCVRLTLPKIPEFYEENKEKRDRLEVLAFHSPTARSRGDLDENLVPIREELWKRT